MKHLLSMTLLFCSAALLAAETTGYRIVHPDGTVEFTDDATLGGEEIKLREVQTVGGNSGSSEGEGQGQQPKREEEKKTEKPDLAPGYTGITIVSPLKEETIWFNENGMEVRFNVLPELRAEDTAVIELDGVPRARGKALVLNVGLVYQGTHSVSAKIVDDQGKTLISSPTTTFYLRQHTN